MKIVFGTYFGLVQVDGTSAQCCAFCVAVKQNGEPHRSCRCFVRFCSTELSTVICIQFVLIQFTSFEDYR